MLTRIILIISIISIFISISFAQLADSAWPMQSNNPQHTGQSKYNGPTTAVQKWTFTTGGPISSSPVIDTDGTIYIGSNDKKLYAVNPNGTTKWEFATGGAITTTPTIGSDGTIIVTSSDAIIYAINSDGTPKWNFKTGGALATSPVIDKNGVIYFGSADKKLYALDSKDGTKKWEFTTNGFISSSPTLSINETTIYFGSSDKFYGVNTSDGLQQFAYTALGTINYSSTIADDNNIYFVTNDYLYCLYPNGLEQNKTQIINLQSKKYPLSSTVSNNPVIDSTGNIYIACNDTNTKIKNIYDSTNYIYNYLICTDSKLKFKFEILIYNDVNYRKTYPTTSTPIIDQNGYIYFGTTNSKIYCINGSGNTIWTYTTGGAIKSSPALAPDGTLYVGCDDGKLYAMRNSQIPPSITLTSPNGGELWIQGSTHAITWTTINVTGKVRLELWKAGQLNSIIADDIDNTGTYDWNIAASQTLGADYKVKIVSIDDTTINSQSSNNFSITASTTPKPTITMTTPYGGEQWLRGISHNISWTSTRNPGNVKIELFKSGILNRTLSSNTSNTGSYIWNIPATQTAGNDYRVKISVVSDATITSESAADFSITTTGNQTSTLTLVSPNGGEQWTQGSSNFISWTSTGNPGNVAIELLKNGILNSIIAANSPDTGTYNWNIPATQTTGIDYRVRISAVANRTITTQSAADFEISTGLPTSTLVLNSPIGGEQWQQGNTHQITWSSTGNPGNIKIELLKNGTLNNIIIANTPDTGSYNWQIPLTQSIGTDYQIKVSAVANSQVSNQSGTYFAIIRGVIKPTLTSPTLYLPANNTINVPVPTYFNWSAVLNAVSYNMQLADDMKFTVNMQENNITSINASTTGLTPGAVYYWRVQAVDANGDAGPWSQIYTFKTITTPITYQYRPDLSITPSNGFTVGADVYDLSGYTQTAKLGASSTMPATYTITVTNNGTQDDIITLKSNNGVSGWKHSFVDSNGNDITNEISLTGGYPLSLNAGASENITLTTFAGNGSSYLSITGKSSNNRTVCDTVIAQAYSISTNQQVFSRPTLISPANNTVITGGLNWSADGTSTGYQIQVSTNANFIKPEVDQFVTSLNSTIGTLADSSTFYWRVRATDSDLALPASQYRWSEWSHVSLFRTGVATPVYSFDVNIYNRSLSGTPLQINAGSNNNQDPATQGAKSRNSAVYYIVITNRGNMSDRFTISDSAILPSDSTLSGWRINITDMRGNNITRRVLTNGNSFTTPVIDPGKKYYFRIEVAASSNTSIGDSADANIVITSSNSNAGIYTTTVRE